MCSLLLHNLRDLHNSKWPSGVIIVEDKDILSQNVVQTQAQTYIIVQTRSTNHQGTRDLSTNMLDHVQIGQVRAA